jgi:exosome complex RNA-binding protein Csl4
VSSGPAGISFRAALANLSEKANAESDTKGDGSQTNSDSSAASRIVIKQEKVQSSASGGDAGVHKTATPPPATVLVANGKNWYTTRSLTGVQIASTPATLPSMTPATAPPLNSTRQTKADNSTSGGGPQTHSDAVLTTATVPPTGQPVDWTADQSSQPTNGSRPSDGSTGTLAQSFDITAPSAAQDVPQQLPLIQSVAGPAERNASAVDTAERNANTVKQLNSAQPSDEGVAAEDQGAAPTIPRETPQAAAGIAVPVNGENFKAQAGLSAATALASHGDWIQPAGKLAAKATNDTAGAKNPDLGSTTEPGKNKASDAVVAGSNGASHGAQSSSQSNTHSQTDPSQGAAVAPKVMDSGTSQAQAALLHVGSHEAAMPLRGGGGVENASHQTLQQGEPASNELDGGDAVASSGINAAKLIHTMGQTEMSVGMRSSEFGNISIRTSVSQQQMLAQISLDHGDLSQALSSHVSSLQSKLENESGLHTLIEVNRQGAFSSSDSGNSAQREQQEFIRSARTANAAVAAEPETGLPPVTMASASNGLRLDIRA